MLPKEWMGKGLLPPLKQVGLGEGTEKPKFGALPEAKLY